MARSAQLVVVQRRRLSLIFALFSEAAELVELCLVVADGTETRTPLTEMAAWVWPGDAPNVGRGQR